MVIDRQIKWPGGHGAFDVVGGGPATLQRLSGDGSTWVNVGLNTTITGTDVKGFELDECYIRATGSATFVNVTVK